MEISKRENSRDAILDAGYDVLARLGYNKTSVDAVAKPAAIAGILPQFLAVHLTNLRARPRSFA